MTIGTGFQQSNLAIIDPKTGRATIAFWRLLENLWQRTGGFNDALVAFQSGDANLSALIESLEAEAGDSLQAGLEPLRTAFGTPDDRIDELEDEISRLRSRLSALDPDFSGLVDTGVVPGTYGSATAIPRFTVASTGVLTAAEDITIAPIGGFIVTGDTPGPVFVVNDVGEPISFAA